MIYNIYILSAALLFAIQIVVMKYYDKNSIKSLEASLFFVVISGTISALIFIIMSKFRLQLNASGLLLSCAVGLMLVICNAVGISAISFGNISIYSMFLLLGGTVLPFVYGIVFLQEKITALKLVGIGLMLVSLILPVVKAPFSKQNRRKFILLCVTAFITNGLISVFSKANQISTNVVAAENFVFYYSVFSVIFAILALIISVSIKRNKNEFALSLKPLLAKKPVAFAAFYAICNGFGNFLLLLGASKIDASIEFPIITGGTIVLTTLADRLIFKTKLSYLAYIGVFLTLLSTIIFAL